MAFADPIPSIQPKTSGLLTRSECAQFLNVGRNEVTDVMRRFEVPAIEGLYPERAIWKRILGVEPQDEPAMQALRFQLQDINWMARTTGKSPTSIRRKIEAGTFGWPVGVQLGCVRPDHKPPRLRRWVPKLVLAARDGVVLAGLQFLEDSVAEAEDADVGGTGFDRNSGASAPDRARQDPENNVLALIARGNAQ